MLRIESPPNSKKLSCIPICFTPNTSSQIFTSTFSTSVRASTYFSPSPSISGFGKSFRPIFPLPHHRFLYSRTPAQHRFDLRRLDPVPPNLHLMIHPSQKLYVPVPQETRTISRPVISRSRLSRVHIRHKPLRR